MLGAMCLVCLKDRKKTAVDERERWEEREEGQEIKPERQAGARSMLRAPR